ncbi:hypothetical protein PIB30_015642 [Stylosanthes scabra]|uniref:FBD domain-containing protein n=1 Tax=Stylosanthes scabra TaxID=79078 RepID=A0ABU6T6T4_9FABA|nr:hypothetical protein [Stylosanthes scabra]
MIEARDSAYSIINEIRIDAPNLEFLRVFLVNSCARTLVLSDFPNMMEASLFVLPKVEHVDWVPKLLQAFSKTKKLELGGPTTKGKHSGPSSWTQPASVPSCVMTHLNILEFRRYPDLSEEREFFAYILQNALVLKTIIIYTNIGSYENEKEHILNEISAIPRGSSLCQVEEYSYLRWRHGHGDWRKEDTRYNSGDGATEERRDAPMVFNEGAETDGPEGATKPAEWDAEEPKRG